MNGEFADPFFDSEAAAHDYLEQLANNGDREEYAGLLYNMQGRKVGEAVEVLTEQSGIMDF